MFSKVCWQQPAMFCLYSSSKISRSYFEFSLKVEVIGLSPGYLLKSFLLYPKVVNAYTSRLEAHVAFSDEGEIWYLYTVSFWKKYNFLIIPHTNTLEFTLNQLVHVDGEFGIYGDFASNSFFAGRKSTFERTFQIFRKWKIFHIWYIID